MFTGPCCLLFVSAPFSSLVSAAVNSHSPPLPVPNQTAMSYISILNCKFNFGSKDHFSWYRLSPNPQVSTFYPKYIRRVSLAAPLFPAKAMYWTCFTTAGHHLKPLVHTTHSFIKDTTHFFNKLEYLGQIPENAFLVTLNVSSLYTNIPRNEGIDSCHATDANTTLHLSEL